MIQGRSSNTGRLQDAKVYISQTAYTGTVDPNALVATLQGDATQQNFEFSPVKAGAYLLIKASGTNNLHLATVEVYGELPQVPVFSTANIVRRIPYGSATSDVIADLNSLLEFWGHNTYLLGYSIIIKYCVPRTQIRKK